jgi:uncharacterized protein
MISVKGFFERAGFLTKILLFIFVVLIFGLIAVSCVGIFTDGNLTNLNNIRLTQMIESIGVFVLPPFVFALLLSHKPFSYLNLDKGIQLRLLLYGVILTVLVVPFINFLTYYNQQITLPASMKSVEDWMRTTEMSAAKITEQLLFVHNYSALLFNLFLIALLPAIGEELFFRGTIQKILYEKLNPVIAVWITAFIFSAFHFQFFGFIPRLMLGALLGYVYLWTKNLWYPVVIHFLNNALAVVFYFLQYNGYAVFDIDKIGTEGSQLIGIVSAMLSVIVIYLIYRYTSEREKNLF